jgi:hypothetical protein
MSVQLTPEQRAEADRAIAEGRRAHITLTPAQKSRIDQTIQREDAHQHENIAMARELLREIEAPGFSGSLRRALATKGVADAARVSGLDADRLTEFLQSRSPLSTDEVDRLVEVLGLRLMADIR